MKKNIVIALLISFCFQGISASKQERLREQLSNAIDDSNVMLATRYLKRLKVLESQERVELLEQCEEIVAERNAEATVFKSRGDAYKAFFGLGACGLGLICFGFVEDSYGQQKNFLTTLGIVFNLFGLGFIYSGLTASTAKGRVVAARQIYREVDTMQGK